jgi:hypothetical protein
LSETGGIFGEITLANLMCVYVGYFLDFFVEIVDYNGNWRDF